jgi:low affinity Fe/Cu permease
MNRFLFSAADFLSRPPGFYTLVIAMVLCTLLVPFGLTNVVTYALSVAAIIITGVGIATRPPSMRSWTKSS